MASQIIIKKKIQIEKGIKVAAFKKEIRNTTPYKHNNYFEIIYLSHGSGMGWYATTIGIAGLVAGLVAGQLVERICHSAIFIFGAGFSLIGVISFIILIPKMNPEIVHTLEQRKNIHNIIIQGKWIVENF